MTLEQLCRVKCASRRHILSDLLRTLLNMWEHSAANLVISIYLIICLSIYLSYLISSHLISSYLIYLPSNKLMHFVPAFSAKICCIAELVIDHAGKTVEYLIIIHHLHTHILQAFCSFFWESDYISMKILQIETVARSNELIKWWWFNFSKLSWTLPLHSRQFRHRVSSTDEGPLAESFSAPWIIWNQHCRT